MEKKEIFNFRDNMLSLFTMKQDQNIFSYFEKLLEMKIKFPHLLFGYEDLTAFIKSYMYDKYSLSMNEEKQPVVGVKDFLIKLDQIETNTKEWISTSLIEIISNKNEKEEENRKKDELIKNIVKEQKNQLDTIEEEKQEEIDNFNKIASITEIPKKKDLMKLPLNSLYEKLNEYKVTENYSTLNFLLISLRQKFTKFVEMNIESINLKEIEELQNLMQHQMKDDIEKIRTSQFFIIFREMSEKSILRLIFFFQKKESNPNEWQNYNPGTFSYKWTGSTTDDQFNVIFEEEDDDYEDSLLDDGEDELKNNDNQIEEEPQNIENSMKIKLTSNENGKFKFSLGAIHNHAPNQIIQPALNNNINDTREEFKFVLSKPAITQNIHHHEKIEEEEQENEINISNQEELPVKKGEDNLLDFILNEDKEEIIASYFNFKKKIHKLYFIKWKNVSYNQCTWEIKENLLDINEKLAEFKKHNRALDKDHRMIALQKKNYHSQILEYMKKGDFNIHSNRRSSGIEFTFNEYNKILYHEMKSDKDLSDRTILGLNKAFKGDRRLKNYQADSLKWMIQCRRDKKNFILADEMGLGKTIQSMAFCLFLRIYEQLNGPFLIVAPLSTLPHWKKTFEEWTSLNVILYHDNESKKGREMCRDLEWYQKDIRLTGEFSCESKICKFDVIITSFEVFIQDIEDFANNLCIQQIIIDEAHRLKNKDAKVIKVFNQLPCRRVSLLTGTPIQNNIGELWSLLNFIEPTVFNNREYFEYRFKKIENRDQLMELKKMIEPYMIRRMKNEVETIPPLKESLIEIELTNFQKVSYKTLYEKNKGILTKGTGLNYISSMNNLEMQLRKCCNHPFLINDIYDNIFIESCTEQEYFKKMLDYSSKMIVLDKLITKYKKEHKKILIFSQFTEMLKIIQEFLTYKKILYKKIDGGVKPKDRENAIESFNSNKRMFEVFLLSTKAGGLGINLTSANVVIIYDSDWNPQNDVQAIARAHRIGQTEEVKVYRLISKKTYEAQMYERASKKLGLDQAVFMVGDEKPTKNGKIVIPAFN